MLIDHYPSVTEILSSINFHKFKITEAILETYICNATWTDWPHVSSFDITSRIDIIRFFLDDQTSMLQSNNLCWLISIIEKGGKNLNYVDETYAPCITLKFTGVCYFSFSCKLQCSYFILLLECCFTTKSHHPKQEISELLNVSSKMFIQLECWLKDQKQNKVQNSRGCTVCT